MQAVVAVDREPLSSPEDSLKFERATCGRVVPFPATSEANQLIRANMLPTIQHAALTEPIGEAKHPERPEGILLIFRRVVVMH